MTESPSRGRSLIRTPLGFAPVLMSLICLGLVVQHVARFGFVEEADEGTAAHLFQLLMVLQLPLIALFAMTWWPRRPRDATIVLAIQALAGLAAFAALFLFESVSRTG